MLVRHRMIRDPQTIGSDDTLVVAMERMAAGQFRRLPVVQGAYLVGILTDRDLRSYEGRLRETRVSAAMTAQPLTISPEATVELAAELMIKHKISGLPVLENGLLVGIITTTDVMKAFLEVMGADTRGSVRIDLLWNQGRDLTEACDIVRAEGGEVLALGAYRDTWDDQPVFYLRLRGAKPDAMSAALEKRGFRVLGIHA